MEAVLTELQVEESVWAEPVDVGLLSWSCISSERKKERNMGGKTSVKISKFYKSVAVSLQLS